MDALSLLKLPSVNKEYVGRANICFGLAKVLEGVHLCSLLLCLEMPFEAVLLILIYV